ncbi:MAG: AMP-binding protein, partial [Candidatus Sericytochromatia bacterium]|nr:AMP-binding protein [Candidatus Sericytochromatia bacterium]
MHAADTLLALLDTAAARNAELIYLGQAPVTWAEVRQRSLAFAGLLQAAGCPAGARILLGLPPGADFLVAFFGAMAAGALPLGVATHIGQRPWTDHPEQLQAYEDAFAPWAWVATAAVTDPGRRWWTPAAWVGHPAGTPVPCHAGDVAFLGLTSGTGGEPKAVMIEHGLTVRSYGRLIERLQLTPASRLLTWIPYHHASGLTASLMAMAAGAAVIGLSPAAIMSDVPALFRALAEHRATHSFVPSFLLKAALQVGAGAFGTLDLSAVRSLQLGGERIDPAAVVAFEAMMALHGLAPGSITPAYGMIEATAIALAAPGRSHPADRIMAAGMAETRRAEPDPAGDLYVAAIGAPLDGVEVRIMADGRLAGDRELGEIEARGASVGRAYWGNPAATAARWQDGWLHTGDLGYLADGRLYVCGRMTDVINIAARKYSAEDIESALAKVPEIATAPMAAVGLPDAGLGTEALAVGIGVVGPMAQDAVVRAIQQALRGRVGLLAAPL